MKNSFAIILAGGDGTRMKSNKPTVMAEVLFKPMIDWVIGGFSAADRKVIDEAVDRALDAAECVIARGVTEAQNRYNG